MLSTAPLLVRLLLPLLLSAVPASSSLPPTPSILKCALLVSPPPGTTEQYEFTIAQSVEASPGRIQLTQNAREHVSADPFATIRGVVSLSPLCPIAELAPFPASKQHSPDSGSGSRRPPPTLLLEARFSQIRVTCDEALTPDARSAECTALYVPLQAEGAFDEAVWLERNASGHVDASRIGHGGRGATVRPRQEIPRSSEEILEI
jgi:hypothetical protein